MRTQINQGIAYGSSQYLMQEICSQLLLKNERSSTARRTMVGEIKAKDFWINQEETKSRRDLSPASRRKKRLKLGRRVLKKHVLKAISDAKQGKNICGPFETVDEAFAFLHEK